MRILCAPVCVLYEIYAYMTELVDISLCFWML
jgi:hypothetical protein